MFRPQHQGLDSLLKERETLDHQSPWRRRYSQSPSLQFFVLSSLYKWSRCRSLPQQDKLDPAKVRLVCVSDTHNHRLPQPSIPSGDVFVHAGDLTNSGSVSELNDAFDWIRMLPHTHKVVIAGNHDAALADPDCRSELNLSGLAYICDESVELNIRDRNIIVYGSPWTPRFGNFAFQYLKPLGAKHWAQIPEAVDVLVTHGLPHAHCDDDGLGCEDLLKHVWMVQPKLMACGHIHAGRGTERLGWDKVQRSWEKVVRDKRKASWWDVVAVAWSIAWSWMGSALPDEGSSAVVNCGIVGGMRDQLIREATIVDI